MSNLITTCEAAIAAIADGNCTPDQVLNAIEFVKNLGDVHKALKAKVDAAAIAYIQARGPIQQSATVRYYVAPNKTTKCLDVKGTAQALLEASGGDWDTFAGCLSSGAFKPAATKKVLGERGNEFFKTEETAKLEETGKPKPALQKFDERFMGEKE